MTDPERRALLRMDLNVLDCELLSALAWRPHSSGMCMCSYYHAGFRSMYTDMRPEKLRFLVRDFVRDSKCDERHENLHRVRLVGSACVLTGTCTFLGRPGCHVRACVAPRADDQFGVEFYFFAAPDGPLLAHTFFNLHLGRAPYEYNPYIVEVDLMDFREAVLDILTCRRRRAAWTIQCAWLRAKFDPRRALCTRLLLCDMEAMCLGSRFYGLGSTV